MKKLKVDVEEIAMIMENEDRFGNHYYLDTETGETLSFPDLDSSLKKAVLRFTPGLYCQTTFMLYKTGKIPLARSMRRLLTGYVVKFDKRHNRNGHLFQNRYKSIVCQEDSYLMELVRYIHLNLIRAGW